MELRRLTALISGLLILAGCGLKPSNGNLSSEDQAVTSDANETDETVNIADSLSSVPALVIASHPMTLASVVSLQKTGTAKFFQPAGCATVDSVGNVVTYTFNGCTGPWGKVKLTGQELATFSPGKSAGQIDIALESKNLMANGTTVNHHADVVVTRETDSTLVKWEGGYTGTTSKGRHVEHDAELTSAHGDDGCTTVAGTTSTTIGVRTIDVEYDDLKRCGAYGVCPKGQVVASVDTNDIQVTLEFDGTKTATATNKNGDELDFTFACTPTE